MVYTAEGVFGFLEVVDFVVRMFLEALVMKVAICMMRVEDGNAVLTCHLSLKPLASCDDVGKILVVGIEKKLLFCKAFGVLNSVFLH